MLEAHAVTGQGSLVYSRTEQNDNKTLSLVFQILGEAGAGEDLSLDVIFLFLQRGILFREREST
jgi:hypothetical protein